MRVVCLVLICLMNISVSFAAEDASKEKLRTLSVHMNSLLNQTELALLASSDFLTDRPSVSGAVVEATLQRYVEQVEGMRAIIVTDAKGYLIYDTFNKVASRAKGPTKPLFLGDRKYFLNATTAKGMKVYHTLIGRTSGFPFLPISRPVFADEKLKHVVIAIMSPNKLIHPLVHDSEYDVVTIYNLAGKFITAFPDGTELPDGFFNSLDIGEKSDNRSVVPFNNHDAHSSWAVSRKFSLVLVYSKIQPRR